MRGQRQELVAGLDRLLRTPIEPAVLQDQPDALRVRLGELEVALVVAQERAAEHHRAAHHAADAKWRRHRAANTERGDLLQIVALDAVVAGRIVVHVRNQQRLLLAQGVGREAGALQRRGISPEQALKPGQTLRVDVRGRHVGHLGALDGNENGEVAQGGDGAIDRDLGGRGRAERLRHVGHHIREQRRLPFSFLGTAVGARGDAGRDDLADGEGDVLFLLAPVPGPAHVLVAQNADDLSADPDGGVEQRADVTRGQVGLQVARPLVPRRVVDRQESGSGGISWK